MSLIQRSSFATPGRAIVKTMTMTTGEFEYDAIFRQFPGGAEDGSITDEIPFPPVSFLLWIIFLVLMPILLTNLLVSAHSSHKRAGKCPFFSQTCW